MDVALDGVDAHLDRQVERRQGVLGCVPARAPVADDGRRPPGTRADLEHPDRLTQRPCHNGATQSGSRGSRAIMVLEISLVEMNSRRTQIDLQLLALRRRAAELEREYARVEEARRRGEVGAAAVFAVRDCMTEVAAGIARLEGDAEEIDKLLWQREHSDGQAGLEPTIVASLETSAELDRQRAEILEALRALAEPLARYGHLAERQRTLTGRIQEATGRDSSYATYIDTALFRAGDYDADLEYVVELLKKTRVVA
jgi:hypothetical protein